MSERDGQHRKPERRTRSARATRAYGLTGCRVLAHSSRGIAPQRSSRQMRQQRQVIAAVEVGSASWRARSSVCGTTNGVQRALSRTAAATLSTRCGRSSRFRRSGVHTLVYDQYTYRTPKRGRADCCAPGELACACFGSLWVESWAMLACNLGP